MKIFPDNPDILIFFLPGLGNAVLLMPMLRAIRKHEPTAHIEMIITQRVVQQLLGPEGIVDKFIFYDNRRDLGQAHYRISQLKLLRQVFGLNYKYYFCVDVRMSPESALLAYLVKAETKIGYSQSNWFNKTLDVTVPFDADSPEVKQRLELLRGLGWQVQYSRPEIYLTKEEKEYGQYIIKEKLSGRELAIAIHPGSSKKLSYKRWPIECFSELIDCLYSDYSLQPILFGGPDEQTLAENIKAHLKKSKVISFAGTLDIRRTAACIAACDYFISNDSGLMHIAAAVGTPQIALFGPTITTKNAPQSPYAIIIDGKKLNKNKENPIENITVTDVLKAFEQLTKIKILKYERKRTLRKAIWSKKIGGQKFLPIAEKNLQKV
jgi:ADP-heptose:LPS heptosyltransferase